jgi:hypothetical protein
VEFNESEMKLEKN